MLMNDRLLAGLLVTIVITSRPVPAAFAPSDDVSSLVARIKSIGAEGSGNEEASRASRELAKQGPAAIMPLLAAMDDADVVASNWLRSAVDGIAEREVAAGRALPKAELEKF